MDSATSLKLSYLIARYGTGGKLYTFGLCSDYGLELDGSTIDEIRERKDGKMVFVFNSNVEDDFAMEDEFKDEDLAAFVCNLERACFSLDKDFIASLIENIMYNIIGSDTERKEFVENVVHNVIEDLSETALLAKWNYDDVRHSLSRVLLKLSKMGI